MLEKHVIPEAVFRLRGELWKASAVDKKAAGTLISCRGLSGVTKGKDARFVAELEDDLTVIDPAKTPLVVDQSSGFLDTKLYLEAAFRTAHPSSTQPLMLGKAAIDDLKFQHVPVGMALDQERVRLLIADDVGLGKTLEAGLVASELILRGRANRILVVTTRSMLTQFQKEFWTRFSIPLSRLDSSAIRRMRNEIPAHYNVFDQFDRSIVSIDTLKKDLQIRLALEESRWDLIIIDEAHNAADRKKSRGASSQRARLAQLLSRKTDSLLLLTATPHDGSHESFASLIEMLDPTRVPDASDLKREDIDDLVVRRFRSDQLVIDALNKKVEDRVLIKREFPLSASEDHAYSLIANLKLELDETSGKHKAIDLFRTTLAKAIFSSPAACRETVSGRLDRIGSGVARGTEHDVQELEQLRDALDDITISEFTKYQDLLLLLKDIKWTGKKKRDRLVIFSERIRTVAWLEEHLTKDLGLPEGSIARIDGGSVEADENTQKILADFGQENAPIRILLASDMASEGLNLHFQSHRLIHFDLPWSLLRFQQRNGRIDRYGQEFRPEIYYFVGESQDKKVRDMWVLEKLVEKDRAAHEGIGDPAVFLGKGDADLEEEVVAEAIASGAGRDVFEDQMDERASKALSATETWDVLLGGFDGLAQDPNSQEQGTEKPPRLYEKAFDYAAQMLSHLHSRDASLFSAPPKIDNSDRLISFPLPDSMKSSDAFGYAREGSVDSRYMPLEALGDANLVKLTDSLTAISQGIKNARAEERSWPEIQFIWDGHPILDWFADCAEMFFSDRAAPVCRLEGRLALNEVAVLLHGTCPNKVGTSVVDEWRVVRVIGGHTSRLQGAEAFLNEVGFSGSLPNRHDADPEIARGILKIAVETFQNHLVDVRRARSNQLSERLQETRLRLDALKARFVKKQEQLSLFDEESSLTDKARSRKNESRAAQVAKTEQMFDDWEKWFRSTCELSDDRHPYVDIKAVFLG